ncbi:alpha/beta hydrolase family protein [Murinocardiopsis flavida]|uniref:Alpha/beta hydrolase family protein n=1 Tax=Murinocardiopsis flavida TaxID=645275 RepID=A0A2P8CZY8_9ACTN|nr:alpha/beta hydrolase [Murinocardiopsis flavida]PSK90517.1 alpha/beta hydrolase family protein [Murinocardiopsis flavida]
MVSWIGYDSPGWTGAVSGGHADDGKDDLQDFQAGLRTTHRGAPSNNTLIGHSYGSTVVGAAARNDSGAYADNLVLVGSPGVGSELTDLKFDGGMKDIHVVMSENDWVRDSESYQTHYFDKQEDPRATHVQTDPETEHDGYFNDSETPEMEHIGKVVAGTRRD